MVSALNYSEMTKHIRNRIKVAGIKAGVRKFDQGSTKANIQVYTRSVEQEFTSDEIEQIARIAQVNGLTLVRGGEIDPMFLRQLTGRQQWNFEFHGAAA